MPVIRNVWLSDLNIEIWCQELSWGTSLFIHMSLFREKWSLACNVFSFNYWSAVCMYIYVCFTAASHKHLLTFFSRNSVPYFWVFFFSLPVSHYVLLVEGQHNAYLAHAFSLFSHTFSMCPSLLIRWLWFIMLSKFISLRETISGPKSQKLLSCGCARETAKCMQRKQRLIKIGTQAYRLHLLHSNAVEVLLLSLLVAPWFTVLLS